MPQKFAPLEVRSQIEKQLNVKKRIKSSAALYDAVKDKNQFSADEKALEQTLSEITPPDVDGAQVDKLRLREKALREALVYGCPDKKIPPMPSEREVWENGSSAAGNLGTWEDRWANHTIDEAGNVVRCAAGKGAKWEYKDIARILGKEEESLNPDVASLENIRPRDPVAWADGRSLVDVPRRSYGLSPQAKANPEIPDSPILSKAQKRAAQGKRMKAYHAARRAATAEEIAAQSQSNGTAVA